MNPVFLYPSWPAPANVRALSTTRLGGVSAAPWGSFNLGTHVGDSPEHVAANRALLRHVLPAEPSWLNQIHGTTCVQAGHVAAGVDADASFATEPEQVCVVMTADCLPVLFCDKAGTVVAAAHAGWRGLCHGVLEQTVRAMGCDTDQIMVWLGPAIGPEAFEVGAEVRTAFLAHDPEADSAFKLIVSDHGEQSDEKYFADIYLLARQRLAAAGVGQVYGGEYCTVSDRDRFYSFRRDGVTGRMASLIWLTSP